MTTPCEVHIFSDNEEKSRMVAGKILSRAKGLEKKYNFYNNNSLLSSLNQRKRSNLDPQTEELLKRAKQFYEATSHIFDVTMGTLVQARKASTLEQVEEKKSKLIPFVGCEHFKIQRHKIIFDNPHTLIDLGGFVKEYAVDMGVKILKKHKIGSALINFGGDIYALGSKPSGEPFSVGIKNPKNPTQYSMHCEISNQALTTSASYERNHRVEGKLYSHIISRSERQEKVASVTVIASSTLESGVYSTSLMVEPSLDCPFEKILL